jgi:hypothetical protein
MPQVSTSAPSAATTSLLSDRSRWLMATLHGHLSRSRDLELQGRMREVWLRRVILALLALVILAALLNVFGQRAATSTATSSVADLTVNAPERLRGGLIFEGRFEIAAHQPIAHPRLVLAPGWTEGMTLNSSEPTPSDETSHDNRLILAFARIPAGAAMTYWTQWSVNPVNVGNRSQDVALYDGAQRLVTVHRDVTIFP